MIKTIALLKRRVDITRDAFARHYEDVHAPLALKHITQLCRYVRSHVREELNGVDPGFDCMTEFWYPDEAAFEQVRAYLQSPAGEPIRRDELTFMDKPGNVFFRVDERAVFGPERSVPLGPAIKGVALLKRRVNISRDPFLKAYESEALPTLIRAAGGLLRCTQNEVLPEGDVEPPYDCATLFWYRQEDGLPAMFGRWAPDAERRLLLSVSESESTLPGASS